MIFFFTIFFLLPLLPLSLLPLTVAKKFPFQKAGGMLSASSLFSALSLLVSPPPPSLTHAFPLRRNFGEELIAKSVEANSLPCVPPFIACDTISYISAHSHTINV